MSAAAFNWSSSSLHRVREDCGNREQDGPQEKGEKQKVFEVLELVVDTGEKLVGDGVRNGWVPLVRLGLCSVQPSKAGGGSALRDPRDLPGVLRPGALENPRPSTTPRGKP